MKTMRKIGKLIALPFRIIDLPFKIARKIVDDLEPERGIFADIAESVEDGVSELSGKDK